MNNKEMTQKETAKQDGRRQPKSIEVPGEPLTKRDKPLYQETVKSRDPLVKAKYYKIFMINGGEFSGPGEFKAPETDSKEKLEYEKLLRDSRKYSEDKIKDMSEREYPTTRRRGRWHFKDKGEAFTKTTSDIDLAEIYRKKMCCYSKEKVGDDGAREMEVTNFRVNKFKVIPIEVIQQ